MYEEEVQTKGMGLIFLTIPAILLMYLCLWFEEKYLMKKKDYLEEIYGAAIEDTYYAPIAVAQAPVATGIDIQQLAQQLTLLLQQPSEQNGKHLENGIAPMGAATDSSTKEVPISLPNIFPEAQQQAKELLQYVAVRKDKFPDDKYTILHFSFRDGKMKRYTRDRIDWFVKHYEEKVAIAEEEEVDKEVEVNRKSKLLYWMERQKELYQKLGLTMA